MRTVDRLNKLLLYYGGRQVRPIELLNGLFGNRPSHAVLDLLDKQAGISTEGGYVGARLSQHESIIAYLPK